MGNQNIPKDQSEAVTYACRIRKVSKYKGAIRRYQRAISRYHRAIRRYQRGNQKIPKSN
jgi:uncharacterized membrane protein